MNNLEAQIREIRQKSTPNARSTREYIGCWSEHEVLDGEIVDALVVVLRTRGCVWALTSGCSMCGYINDCPRKSVSSEDILSQFNRAIDNHLSPSHKFVKIFTSGSFIDDAELSEVVQQKILKLLNAKTSRVLIESRPEYITTEKLQTLKSTFENLEIAIGLESAHDFILENSINKGFKFEDYLASAKIAMENHVSLKTYLLIKPPFLTERECIKDAVGTVQKLKNHCIEGSVSFNPVHIQNYTLVERLWHRREFRPPWLWSVVEVLKRAQTLTDARLISAPTAGGKPRGAHNCGKCDADFLRAIDSFSLSGEISIFDELECECREKWLDTIELEGYAQSGGVF